MDLLQDTIIIRIAPCGQRLTTFLPQKKQCQRENDQYTNITKGSISVGTEESLSVGIVIVIVIVIIIISFTELNFLFRRNTGTTLKKKNGR